MKPWIRIAMLCIGAALLLGCIPMMGQAQMQAPAVWILSAEQGDLFTFYKQDTEKVLYGQYSAKYGAIGTNAGLHLLDRTMDLSAYAQDGYIHLVFYAEKAEDLQSLGYLELSSSGVSDLNEVQFDFTGKVTDGWNHLVFPCNQSKQSIDWKYVNFARLVLKNLGGSNVWVEGVFAAMTADPIDPDAGYDAPQLQAKATADGNTVTVTAQTQGLGVAAQCRVLYDSIWLQPTADTVVAAKNGTQTFSFTAKEGGVALFTVQIVAENGRILASQTARVTVSGRGWYFGDAHTHTVLSDGMDTLFANFETAYKRGSAFIFATDHNYNVTKTAPILEAMQQIHTDYGTDFLAITANELTATKGHSLQYFAPKTYYPQYIAEDYASLAAEIRDAGGLYFLAHPFLLEKFYFPDLEDPAVINEMYRDVTGFEIVNGPYKDASYNRAAIQMWDRYNITGYKHYVAIGDTDAHNSLWVAWVRNYMLLDSVTEENIKNAMAGGHLYVSDGAQLRYTLGGAQMGDTLRVAAQDTQVDLCIEAFQEGGAPIERIEVYQYTIGEDNDAQYQQGQNNKLVIRPQEATSHYEHTQKLTVSPGQFVRVAVYTASGQAYSNPIWIEEQQQATPTQPISPTQPQQPHNSQGYLWIIVVAVAVCVLLITGALVWRKVQDRKG